MGIVWTSSRAVRTLLNRTPKRNDQEKSDCTITTTGDAILETAVPLLSNYDDDDLNQDIRLGGRQLLLHDKQEERNADVVLSSGQTIASMRRRTKLYVCVFGISIGFLVIFITLGASKLLYEMTTTTTTTMEYHTQQHKQSVAGEEDEIGLEHRVMVVQQHGIIILLLLKVLSHCAELVYVLKCLWCAWIFLTPAGLHYARRKRWFDHDVRTRNTKKRSSSSRNIQLGQDTSTTKGHNEDEDDNSYYYRTVFVIMVYLQCGFLLGVTFASSIVKILLEKNEEQDGAPLSLSLYWVRVILTVVNVSVCLKLIARYDDGHDDNDDEGGFLLPVPTMASCSFLSRKEIKPSTSMAIKPEDEEEEDQEQFYILIV